MECMRNRHDNKEQRPTTARRGRRQGKQAGGGGDWLGGWAVAGGCLVLRRTYFFARLYEEERLRGKIYYCSITHAHQYSLLRLLCGCCLPVLLRYYHLFEVPLA